MLILFKIVSIYTIQKQEYHIKMQLNNIIDKLNNINIYSSLI